MIREILAAVLGVFAFAVLFHAPRRSYLACAVCGGVSWGAYLGFTALGLGVFPASMLAILVMTFFARVFSVALEMPSTVFVVSGIFPIVPGAGIYYSAYALMVSDLAMFRREFFTTVSVSGAIALGIIVGMGIPRAIPRAVGRVFGKRK